MKQHLAPWNVRTVDEHRKWDAMTKAEQVSWRRRFADRCTAATKAGRRCSRYAKRFGRGLRHDLRMCEQHGTATEASRRKEYADAMTGQLHGWITADEAVLRP